MWLRPANLSARKRFVDHFLNFSNLSTLPFCLELIEAFVVLQLDFVLDLVLLSNSSMQTQLLMSSVSNFDF